jgi:hypothetical protein
MKVYSCSQKFMAELCGHHKARTLLFCLLFICLTGPATLFSQTVPFSFTPIPYSDPDIIAPGRGAEQWDNGSEKINNPIADSNYKPLDVYYRFPWTRLEDSIAGKYNWTHFDNIIKDAIDHGQKLSFGIMPVYDGEGTVYYDSARSAYPLYLHKLMKAAVVNSRDWISNGVWIPNWNSPHYLGRLKALHVALNSHILASSYKGVAFKDAIYCIDIRGYGNYGEWHNAGIVDHANEHPTGRRATAATLKAIINHHTQVFKLWPLTIMIAAFDGEQFDAIMNPAEVGHYALTTSNTWGPIGWRRDQWGATDTYLDKILKNNETKFGVGPVFKNLITTRYLTSPITGEPPRYVNEGGTCEYWDLERQLTEYGATSLGNGNWGAILSECGLQNARAAFKKTGYRIMLEGGNISKQIAAGKQFSVTLEWKNIGIAPTYENWDVVFELKNDSNITIWSGTSKFKPKRFAPSQTATSITDVFTLPTGIVTDSCTLTVKVKDPVGFRSPLPLAIAGRNSDGSYTIKTINESPANCLQPKAVIHNLPACGGQPFSLILDSASGASPYDLVINGTTYNDIAVGHTITTIVPEIQTIWTGTPSPGSYEDLPVELGVKFKSSEDGFIKGIRFFSPASPAGTYTGHLWNTSGKLLGSVTFVNVTPAGWQEALFTESLPVASDTVYIVSYHTAGGHYAATPGALINPAVNGSLTATASSVAGGNGLYGYGTAGTFPVNSFNATNYWVDVLFTPATSTLRLTSVTDSIGCSNAGILQTLVVTSADSCTTSPPPPVPQPLPTALIANSPSCNGQPFNLVLEVATGAGPYDLVINGAIYNNIAVGQVINTFTAASQTIWDTLPSPTSFEDSPLEVGMKFKSSSPGFIKGVRFFSPNSPSGTYTGHLWSASGILLDSVLFTNVTASGWQEALFNNPVLVVADSIYIASYHSSSGHYAATSGGLANVVSNGILTTVDNNTSGGNGVYAYGATPHFPSGTYNATNYWVDVIFTNDNAFTYTFDLTSVTDNSGNKNTGALQTLTIVSAGNCDTIPTNTLPGSLLTAVIRNSTSCNNETFSLYLDSATGTGPYDLVINGSTYLNVIPGQVITTFEPGVKTIWDTVPSPNNYEDSPVELGVRFKSSVDGYIKGIRFFSPANPSGTYTGHLWTEDGILLDSVTFSGITASGWHEALFTNPFQAIANTSYMVSYHTIGFYAASAGGLANAVTNGTLSAMAATVSAGNGLYGYGPSGTFPTNSFNATNYWVDVIFAHEETETYIFNLTSITDNTGATKSGDLQTLAVSSTECDQSTASRGASYAMLTQQNTAPPTLAKAPPAIKKIYNLAQNYPNPFNGTTTIQYTLPESAKVNLTLFDINGRPVKLLVNALKEAGMHNVSLNAGLLASGLYYYKLQTANFSAVKKLIIQ